MKTNGGSKPPPYVMKLIYPLRMQRRLREFLVILFFLPGAIVIYLDEPIRNVAILGVDEEQD